MIPVVDVSALVAPDAPAAARAAVGGEIDAACRGVGFFCVVGHGIDDALGERVDHLARAYFALDEDEKAAIEMAKAGAAWRGWFPLGGELTSGVPDGKEGLYFGAELGPDHPAVRAGRPLHGPNLFPARPAGLRDAVLVWMDAMTGLGQALCRGLALGLGQPEDWFERTLTVEPTVLFRIFRYPSSTDAQLGTAEPRWGVAEHTDYGLLTIVRQDDCGGLEIRGHDGWVEVAPEPGTLVCNLGDMLDRMTGGRYCSTPHRVRNTSGRDRISLPFFFDPSWDARIRPLPGVTPAPATDRDRSAGRWDDAARRWDRTNPHAWEGTYGEYLLGKVTKVFPELSARASGG